MRLSLVTLKTFAPGQCCRRSPLTPSVIPLGAMYLQPTEERRRSGSHYTPRSLTEPIVRTTLRPVLLALGDKPRPAQILDLKVCDPAMGSGAFLVEACRYLAEALVEAWTVHGETPVIPPDQEPVLHARRLVAQRCLYGVDKNLFAVDLAKLSLWLATLAKDHPFTFLDHSIRCGDSLVGLTRQQIAAFHWLPVGQQSFLEQELRKRIERVSEFRQHILAARDEVPYEHLRQQLDRAEDSVFPLRQAGDIVVAAFLSADGSRDREQKRAELKVRVEAAFKETRQSKHEHPIEAAILSLYGYRLNPFHWELEFPEVFNSEFGKEANGGFHAIIGNPPFLGGRRISTTHGLRYFDFLKVNTPGAGNVCDLAAYFFRRAFTLLRDRGTFGLVATNTISQGDTRNGGLAVICNSGGEIYSVTRRYRWPGRVSVVVSIIHVAKGLPIASKQIDERPVDQITAYLFHAGGNDDPVRLAGRNELFSAGSKIYGQGFLFADDDDEATSLAEMHRILHLHPESESRVRLYMGGNELNSSPTLSPHRYVIFLSDIEKEEELARWPQLSEIVRKKVKPGRDVLGDNKNNIPLKKRWWAYQAHRPSLYAAMTSISRVLLCSQVTPHLAFAFKEPNMIFSHRLNVFLLEGYDAFAVLQSRLHEVWARFFGSTALELLCYTPSDCFETFPMPVGVIEKRRCVDWSPEIQPSAGQHLLAELERIGREYYEVRAELMVRNDEGLTQTYNRLHDKDEQSPWINRLRSLHAEMDRSVLAAYGWQDIKPVCEFLPEFEDEGDQDDESRSGNIKKCRYRWPNDTRDEVLARLLELNRRLATEQCLALAPTGVAKPRKRTPKASGKEKVKPLALFSAEDESK